MAQLFTVRFNVVRMGLEVVHHVRPNLIWEEMEEEERVISSKENEEYIPVILAKENTPKQLLAWSRYILAKKEKKWAKN